MSSSATGTGPTSSTRKTLPVLLEGGPFFKLGNRHFTDVRLGAMPPAEFVEQLREQVAAGRDAAEKASPGNDSSRAADGTLLFGHRKWVQCLAFSPDSSLLASGSADGSWPARVRSRRDSKVAICPAR